MRILVLGGTRFIGPAVVFRLHHAGHTITLFHRGRTHADDVPELSHLHGERGQLAGFRDAFAHLAPDVVLDMAPATEEDARTVMDTFRGLTGRVVAISSCDVYRAFSLLTGKESGLPDPVPLAEDAPLRQNLYPHRGASFRTSDDERRWKEEYDKILVERAVMGDPQLPGTILRLPLVYGPRDNQHRLHPYLSRMDGGESSIALDARLAEWRVSRGYVENVATAIALSITDDRAQGRIYNVAEPDALSEIEWVEAIADAAGWSGEVIAVQPDQLPAQQRVTMNVAQDLVIDSTRIREELDYREVVARRDALQETVTWERAYPPA